MGWGAGRFVAVGEKGAIYTSDHCSAWAAVYSPTEKDLFFEVVYGEDQFVVVGAKGTILPSPDAVTFARDSDTRRDLFGVIHGGEYYVAVGQNEKIIKSVDAITWVAIDL